MLLCFCWFQQITLWLQGLFLFCLVWSLGGTMNGDSRIKFNQYFRTLISGTDPDHPKPKSIKISKVSLKEKSRELTLKRRLQ